MEWDIPKRCVCGYECLNNLSKRHLSSNAHNFFLRDRRRELGEPVRGDCNVCSVKNLKNLGRHNLTNFHIARADRAHTQAEIRHHIQQRANTSYSSSSGC
jgi:hypothetical protein